MIGSRTWFALMRRNFLYRRRHWLSTLLEFVLPIAFVGILIAIKNALGDTEAVTIEADYQTSQEVIVPLSFQDYVLTLQAERTCIKDDTDYQSFGVNLATYLDVGTLGISGMPFATYDWQNPFVRCDDTQCEKAGQDAQPFCEYRFLALAPKTADDALGMQRAQDFKAWVEGRYPTLTDFDAMPFDFDFLQIFASEAALESYIAQSDYGRSLDNPKMSMAIIWDGTTSDDDDVEFAEMEASNQLYKYTLRQNSTGYNVPREAARPGATTTPDTKDLFDHFAPNDQRCPIFDGSPITGLRQASCTGQYLYNGIITIQQLVGDFILDDSGATTKRPEYTRANQGLRLVSFPSREYEDGGFFEDIATFVPLLITLGLLYNVSNMISYIVKEKELRQKELMKMMSVTESDIGGAWFVSYLIMYLGIATCCAIVSTELYVNSLGFVLWLFWVLTFVALIVFCMFIAALSSKTTRTVLIGLLLTFMGVFLTLVVDYQDGDANTIGLLSLHPITAFAYGIQEIGRLEDGGVGVTADTVNDNTNASGYNLSSTIRSLIGDIIIWSIASWYLNRVIKPDFGQALPWYFPFQSSYWCPSRVSNASEVKDLGKTDEEVNDGIPIEGVSDNLRAQTDSNIIIRGLGKQFGEKTAVDDLSMTMYNGQVTALLGHNGAGKTTTISMLTGALAPTSGNASLLGKELLSQLPAVRDDLGICLQHDCLFPNMTVREHIQFFSRLKGLYSNMTYAEAEANVDQIIRDVALYEKRNTFSKNLSGGMKRKLSVAMAFCGGSKVVLLDEPTSGMDPFSRRFTWNVIRQFRQNRCILLTTHFMDEADVLGDRIAIMAEGQLRCCGSPLFLKKHYGVGYQLTIEKHHDYVAKASEKQLLELDDHLTSIIEGNVKDAALLNNVGSEVSFQLPVGEAASFVPMFDGLDKEIDAGKISSYGVGITTLEEVFLLVARGSEIGESKRQFTSSRMLGTTAPVPDGDDSTTKESKMNLEQDDLFFTHVRALCAKRAANFRRDKKAWCCTTILPTLFVLLGLVIFEFVPSDLGAIGNLELRIEDYNPDVESTPRNPIPVNNLTDVFECQPGACAYIGGQFPMLHPELGEAYTLCGIHATVNPSPWIYPTCTLNSGSNSSEHFMETITEAGAETVELQSKSVALTSRLLPSTAKPFQASQYAAIYYTSDSGSLLPDGSSFYDTVVENCTANIELMSLVGKALNQVEDCPAYAGLGYVIQYNYTAYHVTPTYMAVATEGLVRDALKTGDFKIESAIHPLPFTAFEERAVETQDVFIAWFLLVLSFPFIAGSFGTFVVAERESKAKHLQTVTGVKPSGYWVSTYLWDVANYQLPLWIVVILFFIFDISAFTTTQYGVVGGVLAAMILFGPAAAGFTYCVSYFFKSPSLCNVIVIITGFLVGMGGPLTVIILILIGSDPFSPKQNLVDVATILSWVLRLHPCFCLGRALYFSINVEFLTFLYPEVNTVWSPEILLYDVVFLAWESVVYLMLAIKIDIWSTNPSIVSMWKKFVYLVTFSTPRSPETDITTALAEDDDVLAEEERVSAGQANSDSIVVDKLTKIYDNGKKAVNGLSLGIPPGQVFGLLGVNGAGKTTTMQMLTAEFPATSGDATLGGYSVSREPEKTRRRVGYCPQFDAHFANMTGREHVELYATIKGIPFDSVKEAAASKLAEVGLSEFDSNRLAANYSGGMKRRLSLACATIGEPQIVFLDECSTGVDPVARREIWELVSNMVANKDVSPEERTSVILTTHSMEECEALCPRIGIMANGRLRALGSAQHLKNKFGQGYQIEMKSKLVKKTDPDYITILTNLGEGRLNAAAAETGSSADMAPEIFFNLEETVAALQKLTGDIYLSYVINDSNPIGYNIYKSAISETGVSLDELAAFATSELRIRKIAEYIVETYSMNVLRERQDTKVRYEVNSEGVKISNIFAGLEEKKDILMLDDYGVSQTSLEQVFNQHAAQAEKLKHGQTDG